MILTGVFASKTIAQTDGHTIIEGGMIDKNYKQMYKQLVWVLVGSAWSFIVTYLM